jgi:hypothetical protein
MFAANNSGSAVVVAVARCATPGSIATDMASGPAWAASG